MKNHSKYSLFLSDLASVKDFICVNFTVVFYVDIYFLNEYLNIYFDQIYLLKAYIYLLCGHFLLI